MGERRSGVKHGLGIREPAFEPNVAEFAFRSQNLRIDHGRRDGNVILAVFSLPAGRSAIAMAL